jgi:hypothetical protein
MKKSITLFIKSGYVSPVKEWTVIYKREPFAGKRMYPLKEGGWNHCYVI